VSVKKLVVPALLAAFIGLVWWFGSVNSAKIAELQDKGKPYSDTSITTVEPKDGKPGESAYEIAVRNGFEGTEREWLLSLIGLTGASIAGRDGLSAYQIAVVMGYTDSQEQWIASLKGDTGNPGVDGQTGATGADGVDGANGTDGEPPMSWRFTYLATEYECARTDPFDKESPTYSCAPVEQETSNPN